MLITEQWTERGPRIRRLPYPAGDRGDVEGLGRTRNSNDVRDAPAHVRRTDVAPGERGERRRVERSGAFLREEGGSGEQKARRQGGESDRTMCIHHETRSPL